VGFGVMFHILCMTSFLSFVRRPSHPHRAALLTLLFPSIIERQKHDWIYRFEFFSIFLGDAGSLAVRQPAVLFSHSIIFLPRDNGGCEKPHGTSIIQYIAPDRMRFRPLRFDYHTEASNLLQDERKETTKIWISAAQRNTDDDVSHEELLGDFEEFPETKDAIKEANAKTKEIEAVSAVPACYESKQRFSRGDVDSTFVSTVSRIGSRFACLRDESIPTNSLFSIVVSIPSVSAGR
jgi:hypothetical protein